MKGYKVVREDHTHKGFKYKEGLNVDTLSFRAEGSCVPGGLYFFTDIIDVPKWLQYGVYLYEVEVPEGYCYIKASELFDKYRSKALILSNPLDLRLVQTWRDLFKKRVRSNTQENILCWAAYHGFFEIVVHFVENGSDISVKDSAPLRYAIQSGDIYMYSYLKEKGAVIPKTYPNSELDLAVKAGQLELVKYLV